MALGKSLTLPEAVDRVQEWRHRAQSLANSPQSPLSGDSTIKSAKSTAPVQKPESTVKKRFLEIETNL
ncbi:hypothetical protein TELCIR_20579 [Teladorsagia circumcincta]|nr:hypothetical protein TELCIR_20579 [Teladorsagia circumcincta]